ncbi:MAG: type II toxin-antitoxin system VapC family toxin [Archangium sp.]|nr:type II toxin-antitoxin system VapC family toxin [Archangium sp.]
MERLVLLDTHVLLWMVGDQRRVSRTGLRAIRAARKLLLADISFREVATLERAGRIQLDRDVSEWLDEAVTALALEVVAISPSIAARSTHIAQDFHGDPADQLIAATAIELDVPLVTADEQLRASPAVRTIW